LIGGVRLETTKMNVNSTGFQTTNIFRAEIDQSDLLPAASLLYTPRKDMNVRLSYSQTIARPTFREIAFYRAFDPAGDEIVQGNPGLKMSSIENFDVRWEWFTKPGGLLSIGGFYKLLTDPIEKYNASISPDGTPIFTSGDFVTFLNTSEATVWGVEFEARQNLSVLDSLLQPFSIGINFAWIESTVDLEEDIQEAKFITTGKRFETRPLYDQSPYIINADISYDNERTGTSVTLAYYYAAERLALINNNAYDVYEQPAPSLDLVISQRLSKHFKLKFSAENLLNPKVIRSYAVDGPTDKTFIYSSYTRGITFGLSLSAIW
jgi:TonB-dependent receptor